MIKIHEVLWCRHCGSEKCWLVPWHTPETLYCQDCRGFSRYHLPQHKQLTLCG